MVLPWYYYGMFTSKNPQIVANTHVYTVYNVMFTNELSQGWGRDTGT